LKTVAFLLYQKGFEAMHATSLKTIVHLATALSRSGSLISS